MQEKEFNVNGSLTNIILCSLDNEILLNSVQYLMNEDYNVDVLVFDGCMIRRDEHKDITDEILTGLSDFKFVEKVQKDLDTSIDLSIYERH
jgi:hypothetical protein